LNELGGNATFSELKNQLYIYGSLFSENTVGGSRANPLKCPYYITTCTSIEEAQKYDLNYLRRYYLKDTNGDGVGDTSAGLLGSYFSSTSPYYEYPVVIEYNRLIQTNPPIVFEQNDFSVEGCFVFNPLAGTGTVLPSTYTVTFNGNGGTGFSPTTMSIVSGTAIGSLPTNPTRAGYTFNGWYTSISGGVKLTTSTIITNNITYYAQWTAVLPTYTVTFNGNGGAGFSPTTKTVVSGTAIGSLPTNPTRAGYTFNGWYTSTSGGIKLTTSTIITNNITYYAQWTVVLPTTYIVTFNGNGGTGFSPTTKTVVSGTAIGTLPTNPTRAGYTFNGWYTSISGGVKLTTSTIITNNITYYAQWTVVLPTTYTVTFNGNGGTGFSPTTKTVVSGTAIGSLPTNPTRAGYTFNGWYTSTSGGIKLTTSTIITNNITYYAQWTVVLPTYTVTFNGNGGAGFSPTTKTVVSGTAIGSLPTNPTRAGYIFNGWYTSTSGGIKLTTLTIITSNITYYAQWTINTYIVTFNGNGGTGFTPTTKTVTYNTAIGALPTNPTRIGYTFKGWYTATSGGTKITTSTIITSNVTYYAQWNVNNYTITFNANGGTTPVPTTKTVPYNNAIGTLATTTRAGFSLKGWYTSTTGGTKITTSTLVTANKTYYAQWGCPTNYTFSGSINACIKLTKIALNCKSTGIVEGWYKNIVTRCGEQDGIDYWYADIARYGILQAFRNFNDAAAQHISTHPPLDTYLNWFLCDTGDVYIKVSNYCKYVK
ncbi:MAG: InlB B-repeat-containing protein, partial [Candidatus Gracilibacteria bacterium]|nr:InlB B-repeat-containing protein [Candidatus Gracilibacteria bacterium]